MPADLVERDERCRPRFGAYAVRSWTPWPGGNGWRRKSMVGRDRERPSSSSGHTQRRGRRRGAVGGTVRRGDVVLHEKMKEKEKKENK